jgi:hypothetical protein
MDCESVIKTAFEERHLCSKIPKQPCKVDFCILERQGKKPDLMQHKMHKNTQWSWSAKLAMVTQQTQDVHWVSVS